MFVEYICSNLNSCCVNGKSLRRKIDELYCVNFCYIDYWSSSNYLYNWIFTVYCKKKTINVLYLMHCSTMYNNNQKAMFYLLRSLKMKVICNLELYVIYRKISNIYIMIYVKNTCEILYKKRMRDETT